MNALKKIWIKLTPWVERTWRELGQTRGRTSSPDASDVGGGMEARAEPEAHLSIKVTRADGTVEHHTGDTQILKEL